MQLRPYQTAAVSAVYRHLETRDDNPVVCLPTGSGKSIVIAQLCRDIVREWGGRVLLCSHVREILTQNAEKITAIDLTLQVGIYSAGLNRRDKVQPIIIASIQSIFRKACDFLPFDLLILDECHLLSPESDTMYQKFIADLKIINPNIRLVGLSATPFRLSSGVLCGPDEMFGAICYDAGIKELIRDGYLSPLKARNGAASADLSAVHVRGGEYVADEMAAAFDQSELVAAACREIVELTRDRKAILMFCSSVDHAAHVAETIRTLTGEPCGFVHGETPKEERRVILEDFKAGKFRWMSNCNVLTTGFDHPGIDAIVLLRATLSPGLYVQMVGRGSRVAPGKKDCVVICYGGNAARHGPIDAIRIKEKSGEIGTAPVKECPACHALVHASVTVCPECGEPFPPRELKHGKQADGAPILSGEITDLDFEVREVSYSIHHKRDNPGGTPTMRVDYSTGWEQRQSEWVCAEHEGFARQKAEQWWARRSKLPCPASVAEAVRLCKAGCATEPTGITVREISGERFSRIIKLVIGEPWAPGEAWEAPQAPEVQEEIPGFGFTQRTHEPRGTDYDSIPF